MSEEYRDKLYQEYHSQRQHLAQANLETAGRFDRAILGISSGALGFSVAFIDKITSGSPSYMYILCLAWLSLLIAILSQLIAMFFSRKSVMEQVAILDEQYQSYFAAEDIEDAVRKGYAPRPNVFRKPVDQCNTASVYTLIIGLLLILAFSACNSFFNNADRVREEDHQANKRNISKKENTEPVVIEQKESSMPSDKKNTGKSSGQNKTDRFSENKEIKGSFTPLNSSVPPPPPPKDTPKKDK